MGLLLTLWMIFYPADYAHADENNTVQVSPSGTTTSVINTSSTIIAHVSTETATAIIEVASTTIAQAENDIEVIEDNATAIESPTETITATITEAKNSIVQAQAVVDSATVAIAHKEEAETTTATAIVEKNIAISNLETATVTLQTKTTEFNIAKSAVDSQTVVVNTETSELIDLQNTPSNSMTYTTPGYVAPQNVDTNIVSTVVLPPMNDASTKITTPFDIKLGGTLYEGQGNNSQLYVTSKSALTFGQGDHTYWDWPSIAGIYVFQSDYMSSGPGASITVTTTSNTLAISWDLHRFGDNNGPITNTDLFMIVNPESGEWTATATLAGNTSGLYGGPRTGVRPVTGQAVQSMTSVGNEELQSQIADQQAVVQQETTELNSLIIIKNTASAEKTIATQNVTTATTEYNIKNTAATNAIANLTYATNVADQAVALIAPAIVNMNSAVSAAQSIVDNTLAEEEAVRQAELIAEAQRQAAIAEANAREAEAAAQAAEEAAEKATEDRIAAEEAAAQAQAEAEQAAAEAAEAEEAAAQAAAEAAEAEAEAAREAEEAAKAEAEAAEAEAEAARQAEEDAKAEAEAKEQEAEEAKDKEEELKEIAEDAKDGKELTEEQKEVVIEALLENLEPGESISAAAVKASGISYADLPPSTPVEVRTDENGNALVITAAVAANVELVQDPGALLTAAFTDPGAALAALGSIGADMTEAEREEATDMVVATVVAAGAAINAAAVAAGGATGGSGGGGSGGGSGANSPGSRGGRKW